MKQYIKKALWIIPFVFSLNLSGAGATWYFMGAHPTAPEQAARSANWYSNTTGTGGSNPSGNASSYFNQGDIFDFNGYNTKSIDMRSCPIGNSTFSNSGSSVTVTNTGTMTITGSVVFGTTNTTYNFSNSTSTVLYAGSSTSQDIIPFTYYNLTIQGTTISNIAASKNVIVNGTLTFGATNHILTVSGTLELANGSSYVCTTGVSMEVTSSGVLSDKRSSASQNYCGIVKHFTSNDVNSGIYDDLRILANCKLASDIQCANITIGGDVYQYILNLNSKSLTVTDKIVIKSVPANDEYSRINPNNGTLLLNSSVQYDPSPFIRQPKLEFQGY